MRSFRIQERLADLGLKNSAIYNACGISRYRWRSIAGLDPKQNRPGRLEVRWPQPARPNEIDCIVKVTGFTREEVIADLGVDTPDELTGLDF